MDCLCCKNSIHIEDSDLVIRVDHTRLQRVRDSKDPALSAGHIAETRITLTRGTMTRSKAERIADILNEVD